MKGNTKKVPYIGFAACWARHMTIQKPLEIPSSRKNGGKGINSPEWKHARRFRQRFNKSGGISRGKAHSKMCRLGYKSECLKDLYRSAQSAITV